MGWLSNLAPGLFGDSSKPGRKDQREENLMVRQELANLRSLGEQAINRYMPQADQRLQFGLNNALGITSQAPAMQQAALQNAFSQAEGALLGGMNAYRNAILGGPAGFNYQPTQHQDYTGFLQNPAQFGGIPLEQPRPQPPVNPNWALGGLNSYYGALVPGLGGY